MIATGAAFAASWAWMERAFTSRFGWGLAIVTAGAVAAGILAVLAVRLLRGRAFSAHLAAALICTFGLAPAVTMTLVFIGDVLERDLLLLPELGAAHASVFLITEAAAAVYSYLGTFGRLLIPLGAPLNLLFAVLIARAALRQPGASGNRPPIAHEDRRR